MVSRLLAWGSAKAATCQSFWPSFEPDWGEMAKPTKYPFVGIDLTGSETKPSGWALLNGTHVETDLVASDRDLINATIQAHPHVVSIDSPLSVPTGTVIGEDGRVVRYERAHPDSELELRRRGVHLYWCLLPSMQALTLRGMRLAAALREHGVTVIESFPGAAQDILGLPRKQAGVELLAWSLSACGLKDHEMVHVPMQDRRQAQF